MQLSKRIWSIISIDKENEKNFGLQVIIERGRSMAEEYDVQTIISICCTPHLGSAVFLHCSRNQPTAGCIAIPNDDMVRVLRMIMLRMKISIE